MTADLHHAAGFFNRDIGVLRHFVDRRLATLFLKQLLLYVTQFGHRLDHVDRDPDRPGLVGNGSRNRLTNPPGGVGAELKPATIFVFVDSTHQARVAFLNQVKERQATVAVLLGDRNHQTQVTARQLTLGFFVLAEPLAHLANPAGQ